MMQWIGENLLSGDLLADDTRSPVLKFTFRSKEFGVLPPMFEFWVSLLVLTMMGAVFNSVMSLLIWQFIILPRKRGKGDPITAGLVGFGVLMPFCALAPYYGVRHLRVQNKMMKFLIGVAPLTTFFRCSEAVFGFLPEHADSSLSNLIIYNAFPVEVKFEKSGRPLNSSWIDVFHSKMKWMFHACILGFLFSILRPDNKLIPSDDEGETLTGVLLQGFTISQLINNAAVAILFQVQLTAFGHAFNTFTSLLGLQQIPMMLNPIFDSLSVSDFWGKKWNMVVHGMLKRGVYKPIRSAHGSALTATVAAFVASGIFHEWLLSIVFYPDDDEQECREPTCYRPAYGRNLVFFLWNSILIGMEYMTASWTVWRTLKGSLPKVIILLLVSLTALPFAHWFTHDYVRTDFFHDTSIGIPIVVKI